MYRYYGSGSWYHVANDQDELPRKRVWLSIVHRAMCSAGGTARSGVLMEGYSRVYNASWQTYNMSLAEKEEVKAANVERAVVGAVREYLISVNFEPISFNVDVRFMETDRHCEVIAHATETRKVRFEKSVSPGSI
jgi:hypothetical protein